MKKLFAEPEVEILKFLCDDSPLQDSVVTGGTGKPGIMPE